NITLVVFADRGSAEPLLAQALGLGDPARAYAADVRGVGAEPPPGRSALEVTWATGAAQSAGTDPTGPLFPPAGPPPPVPPTPTLFVPAYSTEAAPSPVDPRTGASVAAPGAGRPPDPPADTAATAETQAAGDDGGRAGAQAPVVGSGFAGRAAPVAGAGVLA